VQAADPLHHWRLLWRLPTWAEVDQRLPQYANLRWVSVRITRSAFASLGLVGLFAAGFSAARTGNAGYRSCRFSWSYAGGQPGPMDASRSECIRPRLRAVHTRVSVLIFDQTAPQTAGGVVLRGLVQSAALCRLEPLGYAVAEPTCCLCRWGGLIATKRSSSFVPGSGRCLAPRADQLHLRLNGQRAACAFPT